MVIMEDLLYTVPEVAKLLKCNQNYVYKLMNCGLLRYLELGRRKVRKSTLEEFLAKYDGYNITDPENITEIAVHNAEIIEREVT